MVEPVTLALTFTKIAGAVLPSFLGGGIPHGERADDPDITIIDAANRLCAAFPHDVQGSINALTDVMDDLFQLKDYLGPTCHAEIIRLPSLGNVRSTLEGREGFGAPLSLVTARAANELLTQALPAIERYGGAGATTSVEPEIGNVYAALEAIGQCFAQAFVGLVAEREQAQPMAPGMANDEYVTLLYQRYLGREPDAGGLQHHLILLQTGWARVDVAQGIYDSPEAQAYRTGASSPAPPPSSDRALALEAGPGPTISPAATFAALAPAKLWGMSMSELLVVLGIGVVGLFLLMRRG